MCTGVTWASQPCVAAALAPHFDLCGCALCSNQRRLSPGACSPPSRIAPPPHPPALLSPNWFITLLARPLLHACLPAALFSSHEHHRAYLQNLPASAFSVTVFFSSPPLPRPTPRPITETSERDPVARRLLASSRHNSPAVVSPDWFIALLARPSCMRASPLPHVLFDTEPAVVASLADVRSRQRGLRVPVKQQEDVEEKEEGEEGKEEGEEEEEDEGVEEGQEEGKEEKEEEEEAVADEERAIGKRERRLSFENSLHTVNAGRSNGTVDDDEAGADFDVHADCDADTDSEKDDDDESGGWAATAHVRLGESIGLSSFTEESQDIGGGVAAALATGAGRNMSAADGAAAAGGGVAGGLRKGKATAGGGRNTGSTRHQKGVSPATSHLLAATLGDFLGGHSSIRHSPPLVHRTTLAPFPRTFPQPPSQPPFSHPPSPPTFRHFASHRNTTLRQSRILGQRSRSLTSALDYADLLPS
ncbi:unnamed protein product [Closterium sp. Naga37s-1]|nr:unnamed protein product [Closterium sp. Naga37s-1]